MTGTPKKRERFQKLAAENAKLQRQLRQRKTTSFDPERAKEAGQKSAETRAKRGRPRADQVSDTDVKKALKVLREQLGSPDERIAQDAAKKLLDWKMKADLENAGPVTVVYVSSFADPERAQAED